MFSFEGGETNKEETLSPLEKLKEKIKTIIDRNNWNPMKFTEENKDELQENM